MPQRDAIHNVIRQALIKEGWEITDDPYVISYGERFLFIDLAARLDVLNGIAGRFIGAIAVLDWVQYSLSPSQTRYLNENQMKAGEKIRAKIGLLGRLNIK
jgi:hypothetical protein